MIPDWLVYFFSPRRNVSPAVQRPDLLLKLSKLQAPALFVYGERDIRPSWPIKQVAQLMPNARFELIDGAEHVIWFSPQNELRVLLREFICQVTFDATRASHP